VRCQPEVCRRENAHDNDSRTFENILRETQQNCEIVWNKIVRKIFFIRFRLFFRAQSYNTELSGLGWSVEPKKIRDVRYILNANTEIRYKTADSSFFFNYWKLEFFFNCWKFKFFQSLEIRVFSIIGNSSFVNYWKFEFFQLLKVRVFTIIENSSFFNYWKFEFFQLLKIRVFPIIENSSFFNYWKFECFQLSKTRVFCQLLKIRVFSIIENSSFFQLLKIRVFVSIIENRVFPKFDFLNWY